MIYAVGTDAVEPTKIVEQLLSGGITLVAAFAGAYFAFLFERNTRKREETERQVAAGNLALFTLSQIWNILHHYETTVIGTWKNKPDAWLNMPESESIVNDDLKFQSRELAFLFHTHAEVLQLVTLEGDRFRFLAHGIDTRNSLIRDRVAPNVAFGVEIAQDDLVKAIGEDAVRKLQIITPGIITQTVENLSSSREAFDALRLALKNIHPKQKFIKRDWTELSKE